MAGEDGSKAMRPSAYDEVPAADTVVEHRDQVKVTFKGGNVFHIQVDGVDDAHEMRRGGKGAWTRAEALRKELNPNYAGPPQAPADETATGETGASAGSNEDAAQAADKSEPPAGESTSGTAPAQPVVETPPEAPAPPEPKADEPKAEEPEPDVVKEYRVGDVVGVTRMVPTDVVMDMLGGNAGRVALLQGSDEARRLSRRVRATDGRCAPIFFTRVNVGDSAEVPALYDGLYMPRVPVVILPSGEVGRVQGHVAALMRANLSAEADDDEMVFRAFDG
jgi:hypothetical protein